MHGATIPSSAINPQTVIFKDNYIGVFGISNTSGYNILGVTLPGGNNNFTFANNCIVTTNTGTGLATNVWGTLPSNPTTNYTDNLYDIGKTVSAGGFIGLGAVLTNAAGNTFADKTITNSLASTTYVNALGSNDTNNDMTVSNNVITYVNTATNAAVNSAISYSQTNGHPETVLTKAPNDGTTNYICGAADFNLMRATNVTYELFNTLATNFTFPPASGTVVVTFNIINESTGVAITLLPSAGDSFLVPNGNGQSSSNYITIPPYFGHSETWKNVAANTWQMIGEKRTKQELVDLANVAISNNAPGFVTATVTNGLATTAYVQAATNGFVTASVTNGLATTAYVNAATNGMIVSNSASSTMNATAGFSATGTNAILSLAKSIIPTRFANEASAAALPAYAYVAGVITETGLGALVLDGITAAANDEVLIKDEATKATNGLYVVTVAGSAGAAFVLTRDSNFNSSSNIQEGDIVYVDDGATQTNTVWALITPPPYTVGTTPLTFVQTGNSGSGGSTVNSSTNFVAGTVPLLCLYKNTVTASQNGSANITNWTGIQDSNSTPANTWSINLTNGTVINNIAGHYSVSGQIDFANNGVINIAFTTNGVQTKIVGGQSTAGGGREATYIGIIYLPAGTTNSMQIVGSPGANGVSLGQFNQCYISP